MPNKEYNPPLGCPTPTSEKTFLLRRWVYGRLQGVYRGKRSRTSGYFPPARLASQFFLWDLKVIHHDDLFLLDYPFLRVDRGALVRL